MVVAGNDFSAAVAAADGWQHGHAPNGGCRAAAGSGLDAAAGRAAAAPGPGAPGAAARAAAGNAVESVAGPPPHARQSHQPSHRLVQPPALLLAGYVLRLTSSAAEELHPLPLTKCVGPSK